MCTLPDTAAFDAHALLLSREFARRTTQLTVDFVVAVFAVIGAVIIVPRLVVWAGALEPEPKRAAEMGRRTLRAQ